jgi:biopolymer transport protein ExbD
MRFRAPPRRLVEPDMTPMIDVTFLLLIFFLVTAQMAAQSRRGVHLPVQPGESRLESVAAGLVVVVEADGRVRVGDRGVDSAALQELARDAAARAPAVTPVIRADRSAPAAALNAVTEALRQGGAPGFRLATESGGRP